MRAVVGVTDNAWAGYLRDRPDLTEANFWLPSPNGKFKALEVGEPFLFKTHHPENQLVGGGFFSGYNQLTIREAWEFIGHGNGVGSAQALADKIGRYRKVEPSLDLVIGCVFLRDLFFTPTDMTLPAPSDFAPNIVRFKGYDLGPQSPMELHLAALLERSEVRQVDDRTGHVRLVNGESLLVPGPTRGIPRLVTPRLGQGAFKGMLLTAYHRQCAITGGHISPTLQAAHIRPVAQEGQHRLDNGLLLRSDVHILFDNGYLGIDEQHKLHVSPRLWTDFGNGKEFYSKAGETIDLPERTIDRPARDAVQWHMDEVFLR